MYDWLTTAPQYYEKYTYDTKKLANLSSFKTLPPKPVTNRVNRLSKNLVQKRNLSNTRRSSYQIEDTYPKYVYQGSEQSLSLPKAKYIQSYSSSNDIRQSKEYVHVVNEPHYITLASNQEDDEEVDDEQYDDVNDETNDAREYYQYEIASYSDPNSYINTKHNANNENVVYFINNPDDYGK
jgi:hypothetical protein